ncbi:hypothetical protein MUK42_34747 [Musa troglodytarum]|uniref:Uncharacterized protein n=1 Tax=Musa troglodytarum TaxID=320322 RepID=A0A9E7GFJ6_9LILI|nr:hypothetical protein MUK42_34747 [Musa troglodytarum]
MVTPRSLWIMKPIIAALGISYKVFGMEKATHGRSDNDMEIASRNEPCDAGDGREPVTENGGTTDATRAKERKGPTTSLSRRNDLATLKVLLKRQTLIWSRRWSCLNQIPAASSPPWIFLRASKTFWCVLDMHGTDRFKTLCLCLSQLEL